MASVDELWARLLASPADGDLTLDLAGSTFMDSSGLRVFLAAADARTNGSCVVLKNPCGPVAHVLEIALPGGGPGLKIERIDGGSNDG